MLPSHSLLTSRPRCALRGQKEVTAENSPRLTVTGRFRCWRGRASPPALVRAGTAAAAKSPLLPSRSIFSFFFVFSFFSGLNFRLVLVALLMSRVGGKGALPQLHPRQRTHALPSPVPSRNAPKHHIFPNKSLLFFFLFFHRGIATPSSDPHVSAAPRRS